MKRKRILPAFFLSVAFAFEWIPSGVMLFFANPEGEPFRRAYSFFSLVPYGYGTVGPFLCAILTVISLLAAVLFYFKPKKGILPLVRYLSLAAALLAATTVLNSANRLTYIGFSILLLLAGAFTSTYFSKK